MNYQLVLQFSASSMADFDRLVTLEKRLMEAMGHAVVVDGHDFGSGTFNIFIFTNEPTETFSQAREVVLDENIPNELRAAYREASGENYIVLWPSTLAKFSVL